MKNLIFAVYLLFSFSISAQSNSKTESVKIKQITCIKKKGTQLVLKEVLMDSRCPQEVNCIWAGEATVLISVYKDGKLIEDKTIILSSRKEEENKLWFASNMPSKKQSLNEISLVPYPKKEVKITPKDYYINISYLE